MKILITGANGQLGTELRHLLDENQIEYVGTDATELDITDSAAVTTYFEKNKPELVYHCAAYTAVDAAEEEPGKSINYKVNVVGTQNIANAAEAIGATLVYISTDYVFDGRKCHPYVEDDEANPQSVYGKSKLAGEQAVLETASSAVVLRTAWLYSPFGNNFVKTMLRLGAEKEELKVVFDQVGTPTYAAHLAQAVVAVLPRLEAGYKEVFHFSNEGVCSWYDFAAEIMAQGGRNCKVLPIESKDYPTAAERPAFSVLNKTKFKTSFGMEIPHWKKGLEECLKRF